MTQNQTVENKLREIINRGLCSDTGVSPEGQVCVEQAIALAMGEPLSDNPKCVAAAVRAHSIALNDRSYWSSPKFRGDSMLAYALTQLGCKGIDEMEFVKRLALENIRQLVPIALRAAASLDFFKGAHAEALEAAAKGCELSTDSDTAARTANTAADAARTAYTAAHTEARTAVRTAYTAAYAANTAADAALAALAARTARTAELAANTAALAARTAAHAANTATDAANAAYTADTAVRTAYTAAYAANTAADAVRTAAYTADTADTAARTADTAARTVNAADAISKLASDIACKILENLKKEAGLL